MKNILWVFVTVFLMSLAGVVAKNFVNTSTKSTNYEAKKSSFISSCVAKGAKESKCICSWDKIIEKYGNEGYSELTTELGKSGTEGLKTNPKLKELVAFMTNEIPVLCKD